MGGSTVEEAAPDWDQANGAMTINGGRAIPEQTTGQPQPGRAATDGNPPHAGQAWSGQQAWDMRQPSYHPTQAWPGYGYPQGQDMPPQQQAFPATPSYPQAQQPTPGSWPSYPQAFGYPQVPGHPQAPIQPMQQPQGGVIQPQQQGWTPGFTPEGAAPASVPTPAPARTSPTKPADDFDYSNIDTSARVAIYDDLHSAPRVIRIPGGPTHEFIERIASLTYQHSQATGGRIPYSVIREVSENFIHAQFKEVVVSILDAGNTIRFTDQGPGIKDKSLVQMPGVTSATEPMKQYIRGVGSGLPLVKDALSFNHGSITIEDNINSGAVVTISLMEHPATPGAPLPSSSKQKTASGIKITSNDRIILKALEAGPAGVTAVSRETGISVSSVHNSFERLTQAGLVEEIGKERHLTQQGLEAARQA